MRAIGFVVVAVVALAGAACSGGDSSGSGGSTGRGNGALAGGAGAGARPGIGAGGAPASGGAVKFGNPNGPPTGTNGNINNVMGGAGGAGAGAAGTTANGCVAGKFCQATAADSNCGTITFNTTVKMVMMPGNALLIFDRSFSMTEMWQSMVKYQAAGSAVIGALTPIADLLTIGGIFFPSETPGPNDGPISCAVDPFSSPEQLAFQPGAMALQKIQGPPPSGNPNPMYAPIGSGMNDMAIGETPTTEAIMAADVALQNATLTGATVAILITDGAPNCGWNQDMTTATVAKWLSQLQIKTYVIGLPGVDAGMSGAAAGVDGPTVLNAIAKAGGTDMYITPDNGMALQMKLQEIVSSTVKAGFDSCSIDLMPPTDVPDMLQLVLTETVMGTPTDESAPHDLGNGGGWTITPDGMHVQLIGSLCSDAMGGRFDSLKFTYGCQMLPPVPPTPPPE
jgi:hypothetical protein